MKKITFLFIIIIAVAGLACTGGDNTAEGTDNTAGTVEGTPAAETEKEAGAIATPMEAVKVFIEGIRAKDDKAIRSALSKATVEKFEKMAEEGKVSFFDAVVGEDLEEMSKMPEMRNEKVDGDKATVEMKNDKNGEWDEVPFVKEDGSWKIALFDDAGEEKQQ